MQGMHYPRVEQLLWRQYSYECHIMKANGQDSTSDKDIVKNFDLNLKILSMIGLHITFNKDEQFKRSRFADKIPVFLTNGIEIFDGFAQMLTIINSFRRDDKGLALQASGELFSNMLCVSKGYRMASSMNGIQTILQQIVSTWRKYPPYNKRSFQIAEKTLLFCKICAWATLLEVIFYGLPALQHILFHTINRNSMNHSYDYSNRVFLLTYPFPIADDFTYLCAVVIEEYILFMSGFFWVVCFTLFAQTTTHISLQFEELQYDVSTLITEETSEDRVKENFSIFVKRHRKLLGVCDEVEKVFSPIILITVVLSAANMCLNVFEINEWMSQGDYEAAARHGSLFMNTFFEILFYCIFAESLTKQTSSIANTIYNSNWMSKNAKFKVYVLIMIQRSQKPFYCTAYGFFPIGHQRLTMVINTTFSYYMMLKATSKIEN